jgi:hypothetical protein
MQRWWFLDDRKGASKPEVAQKMRKPVSAAGGGNLHKFRVHITETLLRDECVAITGNCEPLGNWDPQHAVQLKLEDGECNLASLKLIGCKSRTHNHV